MALKEEMKRLSIQNEGKANVGTQQVPIQQEPNIPEIPIKQVAEYTEPQSDPTQPKRVHS